MKLNVHELVFWNRRKEELTQKTYLGNKICKLENQLFYNPSTGIPKNHSDIAD